LTHTDKYKNFQQLSLYEKEEEDFEIRYIFRSSEILIMAPHGGMIEPYTGTLAELIAGDFFSCYIFKGIKKKDNRLLHLTSHHFDEPAAMNAARHADTVVAIHGVKDKNKEFIMIGGTASSLCNKLAINLKSAGFHVMPPTDKIAGTHPGNICNKGKSEKGIQLELSYRLREMLMNDIQKQKCFCDTIRFSLIKP